MHSILRLIFSVIPNARSGRELCELWPELVEGPKFVLCYMRPNLLVVENNYGQFRPCFHRFLKSSIFEHCSLDTQKSCSRTNVGSSASQD